MNDPRTQREKDEAIGVDVDDPGYVSGDDGDPYADEGNVRGRTRTRSRRCATTPISRGGRPVDHEKSRPSTNRNACDFKGG
jgi:hypothetical protein